jgi:hypothetical protein
MSIAAISSNTYANYAQQSIQSQFKQFQQEFQQLGSDLQSGNVKAAQQDLSALQQLSPQGKSTSSAQSNNPVAQEFTQLSQALQSGNIASAQQNFANVQQAFQNQTSQTSGSNQAGDTHHAHHHHRGGSESSSSDSSQSGSSPTGSNLVRESASTLGQYSPSTSLSAAQQAYTGFQNFQGFGTTVPIETSPLLIGPSVSFAA